MLKIYCSPSRASTWIVLIAFGGLLSVVLGRDTSWDLRNYHLYTPYQFLHGRLSSDIAAAQLQTYFNPLSDLVLYGLTTSPLNAFPRIVSFVMGAMHGLNACLLWAISCKLISAPQAAEQTLLRSIALLIGVSGAGLVSVVGTSSGDLVTSIFILASLYLLLVESDEHRGPTVRNFVVSGICAGVGIGLKYTSILFLPGLCLVATIVAMRRRSFVAFAGYGVGGAIGLAAAAGQQLFKLWVAFANPVFPLLNTIFRSPFAEIDSYRDTNILVPSWTEAITLPFYWIIDSSLVNPIAFSDPRCALAYVAIVVGTGTMMLSGPRRVLASPLFLSYLFVVSSFAFWLLTFLNYRYILVIEMMSGPIVVATIVLLAASARARAALAIACLAAAAIGTHYFQWGRGDYGGKYVDVSVPKLPANSVVLLPTGEAVSYFIPFSEPSATYVGIQNNFLKLSQTNQLAAAIRATIAATPGPIFALQVDTTRDERLLSALDTLQLKIKSDTCAPITSNIDATPLALCELERGAPDQRRIVEIVAFGPDTVQLGKPFNVQPNGLSAMWLRASGRLRRGTQIRLGDIALKTNVTDDLATALVPAALLLREGSFAVTLVDPNGDSLSNSGSLKIVRHLENAGTPDAASDALGRGAGNLPTMPADSASLTGPRSPSLAPGPPDLKIAAFGPAETEAGQPFNVQPDGSSAIWLFASKEIPAGSNVRLGATVLKTVVEGRRATATVPTALIRSPAQLAVVLIGPDGSLSSEAIMRIVGQKSATDGTQN